MKKILCSIAAALVLLPLALQAQDFNPARGPLEGVWKDESNATIIFVGNLVLEPSWDSVYDVMPGVIYRNNEILGPDDPGSEQTGYSAICSYELSGNTLKLTGDDGYEEVYVRSGDDILRSKSRLEGVWAAPYSDPDYPGISADMTWIFTGRLMIMMLQSDSVSQCAAAEFSCSDEAIILEDGSSMSYTISGNVLTLIGDSDDTFVLTKK
jgi:hypothetical protein